MKVRLEIDPADAGVPHTAPLRRAMEQTAALDIIDRPTPREPRAGSEWHSLDSALVAEVRAKLAEVRRHA